jgi:iron(III) transport system substrate-binding protein
LNELRTLVYGCIPTYNKKLLQDVDAQTFGGFLRREDTMKFSRTHRIRARIATLATLTSLIAVSVSAASAEEAFGDQRKGEFRIYISMTTSKDISVMVEGFNKHFPNIKVDWVRAGSLKTVNRFVAERQAGRVYADLVHAADPGGFYYFADKGWIDKRLAELPVTEDYREGFYDKEAGWVAMRATGIALMYNASLLNKEDAPKSWKELVDRKWKGKIAMADPTRAGSSFSFLYAMWKLYGVDYLKELGKNDILVVGEGGGTRIALANGERALSPVSEYDAFRLKKEGLPVDVIWPTDGTIMVPAPLALVKGSLNPDAALLFAKYILSKEGQEILTKAIYSWSAHKSVAAPEMKPELNQVKLLEFDWRKAEKEKNTLLDLYFEHVQPK